jgi:hypothetical protein
MENQPQQPQPQEKPKKSVWKKWWFWVIIVFVIWIIASVGGGEPTTTPVSEEGTPTAETEITQEQTIKDFYSVGEAINISNRILTVNSVEKDWQSGNEFDTPSSPNKKFVVVNITLENKGSDKISFDEYDFDLQDANGVINNATAIGGVGLNQLSSGELTPGGKKTGDLIYEVDESGLSDLTLTYTADFWGNKTIKVKLQ